MIVRAISAALGAFTILCIVMAFASIHW